MSATQPREHSVLCSRCLRNQTWNVSALCDTCERIPLRRTSVFEVRTAGDHHLLLEMVARCHAASVEVAGSGRDADGTVFVRVRVADDSEALSAALAACAGREFTLVTGYGINRREVLSRPESGEES